MRKNLIGLYLIVGLFSHCSKHCDGSQPLPTLEQYEHTEKAPPLSKAWEKQLARLEDKAGEKRLAKTLIKFSPKHRQFILEILQAVQGEEQQKHFLSSLAFFDEQKQAHLINIILYLRSEDEALVFKIARCPKCLTFFEKLKFLKLERGLSKKCRELFEEFEKELDTSNS